jgi:2-oxoglutarate ferredoxin oxidoreductase subunit alpha
VLKGAKRTICVENNATSQFARLMRAETGHTFSSTVTKYDGRPYLVETVLEGLKWRD